MRRALPTLLLASSLLVPIPAAIAGVPTCAGQPATHVGTPGDDVIVGTDGADVIVGLGGNDTIRAKGGDDLVCAGAGDDEVRGGPGNDDLRGQGGDDDLRGNGGDDELNGGQGEDELRGRGGMDTLLGGGGPDLLHGGPDTDRVDYRSASGVAIDLRSGGATGQGQDDLVRVEQAAGSGDDDVIKGRGGDDKLIGRSGNDLLVGRNGDDVLIGGDGTDTLRGQNGADTCREGEKYVSCLVGIKLREVARLPSLDNAGLAVSPADDDRLFIIDQEGLIRILEGGDLDPTPFLDISDDVLSGGERGLLGLAFHPDFAANGKFYVNYTAGADGSDFSTFVVEFVAGPEDRTVDPGTATELLEIPQPYGNHNGGMLAFGPDGYLYISTGDGGGAGDPDENGQDTTTLHGAILRIDVDSGSPYAIPADNPFVGGPGADEIWAYGLRNPWRFSFDEGLIYIGDVGQYAHEEIDVAAADAGGLNYGWNTLEGEACFDPPSGCSSAGTVLPVLDIPHDPSCSVIGGFVYRGSRMPEVDGHYFYSDFCGRYLRSFLHNGGDATQQQEWAAVAQQVTSMGMDASGDLYVSTIDGRIYKLLPIR